MPVDKPTKEDLKKWDKILLDHDLGRLWIIDHGPKLCYGEFDGSKEDDKKERQSFNYTIEGERKDARRGNFNIPSVASRKKMSRAHKGHKHSSVTKEKMSLSHIGIVFTPEHKANIKAAALKRTPRAPSPILCIHLDRKHYALGKCEPCWRRDRRKKK